ncbi:polyprenol monophosphomannose synthase [Acetobacteroides hydrogenigenes]|uniref:Dolichol-phosphate mannosyltransferase n=1 Tax=Acetobacteroides hydrogenigenes TaxID=979970 RepID=A0A4R2E6V7_9BACT|nr:polyprenol monophosphomannose synthase [Acetobacteroides hydrogenigenes]TCN61374.1 dolichol-phosphate mannosyltransferase [Acetobacteroides hydrogenigenes]
MLNDSKVVIIPTYNEIENIEAIITKVLSLHGNFHILIIDDGSPDGTASEVKRLQAIPEYSERIHLIERSGKLGLGTAYITGFKWAVAHEYDFIFEMDADFSHNPDDLIRLYDACHEGADLAIGSRYVNGVTVVEWPIGRIIMSYYASAYVRYVTGMPVKDTTAGFKCYRRKVLETINLDAIKLKGYGFQIEMKYNAYLLGFKIAEVPIIFRDRTKGTSKMSGGIFGEAFWGVLNMRLRSVFGKIKEKPKA